MKKFLVFVIVCISIFGASKQEYEQYMEDCKKGNMFACEAAGEYHYFSNGGIDKNTTKALELFSKACEGNVYSSCYNTAYIHTLSNNMPLAVIFYEKSCDGGHYRACIELGDILCLGKGVEKDVLKGKKFLIRACENGYSRACDKLIWY